VVRSHDVQMTCRARLAPVEVSELSEEIGLGWRGVVSAGSAVQCSAVQSRRLNIRRQKSSSGWWQACSFGGLVIFSGCEGRWDGWMDRTGQDRIG